MPATWELLEIVHQEANVAANQAKNYFHRMRPYSADLTLAFAKARPIQQSPPIAPILRAIPHWAIRWA
jgi:acid phosphatase (class A)